MVLGYSKDDLRLLSAILWLGLAALVYTKTITFDAGSQATLIGAIGFVELIRFVRSR